MPKWCLARHRKRARPGLCFRCSALARWAPLWAALLCSLPSWPPPGLLLPLRAWGLPGLAPVARFPRLVAPSLLSPPRPCAQAVLPSCWCASCCWPSLLLCRCRSVVASSRSLPCRVVSRPLSAACRPAVLSSAAVCVVCAGGCTIMIPPTNWNTCTTAHIRPRQLAMWVRLLTCERERERKRKREREREKEGERQNKQDKEIKTDQVS